MTVLAKSPTSWACRGNLRGSLLLFFRGCAPGRTAVPVRKGPVLTDTERQQDLRAGTGTSVLAVACAAVFMAPSPAAAAQAPQATAGSHCVADLDTQKTTCYDTFRESVAAATGGRITDAAQERAARDKDFVAKLNTRTDTRTSRAASNTHVVGVFYWEGNYTGHTWIARAGRPCLNDGSWDHRWRDLGGWNDAISSLQLAGNCYVRAWEHSDYGGATQYYTSDTAWVGDAMNDRISSLQFQ